MTPPLPVAPLTDDDELIWAHLGWGNSGLWRQLAAGLLAERRDAELIYGYEVAKANLIRARGLAVYEDMRHLAAVCAGLPATDLT